MSIDHAWLEAWAQSSDLNIATQVQDINAFNGQENINPGNVAVVGEQNAGDDGIPSGGYGSWSDVNVATQVQTVAAFNGVGNVNEGSFTVIADQDVGSPSEPINDARGHVHVDTDDGINVAVQVQTVAAFNGVGNVNAGEFKVAAIQNVGDGEGPSHDSSRLLYATIGPNVGEQIQNVTAFNGVGNVNAGEFDASVYQDVGYAS